MYVFHVLENILKAKEFLPMSVFTEIIDKVVMANSVCWNGHVVKTALGIEVEGQRKKPKRAYMKTIEEESMKGG